MPGSRHQQIKTIFLDAKEKPLSQRGGFLDHACAGDPELRSELEILLAASEEIGAVLNPDSRNSAAGEGIGDKIGRYRILELIGEGGFGNVYMAEQETPVRRKVALKIIKLGMDTKQVIARFEAERQALAMMDHPNIAKVFDAGTTETGRPYFVMDLVRGLPITQYCDQEHLSIRQRIELFSDVCKAIQHAHQKGIIHRDIKPSNVLVTMHDDKPVPKVIDFGIAKAIDQRLTEKTLFTEFRQFVGTPAYVSPEQAQMGDMDIDTRSDVYSLGVLLYELLAGSTPLESSELMRRGYDQMQQMIREKEPARPSDRLSSLTSENLTTIAKRRSSDARELSRAIRGDADWIVIKCLEKDRRRRYESASALAKDLERYLANEPVEATPPSVVYRLQKFIRRNRTGLGIAATILLLITVSVGLYIHGIRGKELQVEDALAQVTAERQEADRQRDAADTQKQSASAVSEFLIDMLLSASPWEYAGDNITVLQMIKSAQKKVDQGSLKSQPLVEASIREAIGEVLTGMGHYDDAETDLRQALSIRQRLLPPDDPQIAKSLKDLGYFCSWYDRYGEGEALTRQALAINQKVLPPDSKQIGASLKLLSFFLGHQHKYKEAEAAARQSMEIYRKASPPDYDGIASVNLTLAQHFLMQGDTGHAEVLAREAVRTLQESTSPQTLEISFGQDVLGRILLREDKLAEADELLHHSAEGFRKADGDERVVLVNLLTCLTREAKYREGDAVCLELLDIDEKSWPARYQRIGMDMAAVLRMMRDEKALGVMDAAMFQREEAAFLRLLKLEQQKLSPNDPYLVSVYLNTGFCEKIGGRLDKAEELVRQSLRIASNTPASGQHVLVFTDARWTP